MSFTDFEEIYFDEILNKIGDGPFD